MTQHESSTGVTVTAEEITYKAAVERAHARLQAAADAVAEAATAVGTVDGKIAAAIAKAGKRVHKAERITQKRLRKADRRMYDGAA